ncbi:MAG: hypothetical protein ACSLE3_09495 [Microbacteriaceae bacterium]
MASTATVQAARTVVALISPGGERLVGARDRPIAGLVQDVVRPADGELAGQHRQAHEHEPPPVEVSGHPQQQREHNHREGRPGVRGP